MQILLIPYKTNSLNNISFYGKYETFWKNYNKSVQGVPLKDTILNSISKESNLLGEGLNKKGYALDGIDKYIIRIYKNKFKTEDLDEEFLKSRKNYIDTVDGVALRIPDKLDIVRRKHGVPLGVKEYGVRICPPMDNLNVSREETLNQLNLYEKLKDFPIQSYKQAYAQIKLFCSKPGYQFDIVNPNNIIIDIFRKKINFIDPMDPAINKCEKHNLVDFSKHHGSDSLYPVLCDFLMQEEHLSNLTSEEKERWKNSIEAIITKSIIAGKEFGFQSNIDNLKFLYNRIDKLWYTLKAVPDRYDHFIKTYSDTIKQANIISDAINYKNNEKVRIHAIQQLNSENFNDIKPIFQKIIKATHQPKVEIPEILNPTIDKIAEYGKNAKSILPDLEILFDKEIFYPTKKKLYNLFIQLEPDNKKFLVEIDKSADNCIEKTLYEDEFSLLKRKAENLSTDIKEQIDRIFEKSKTGNRVSPELANKLWISRTCTNSNSAQELSLNNMVKAYEYIYLKINEIPKTDDLIKIHQIVMKNTPEQKDIIGKFRTKDTEYLFNKIFNIKQIPKTAKNPYADSNEVTTELKKLDEYINKNYFSADTFELAAKIFSDIVWIHPFFNGNGRVARLFTEQLLLSKGYKIQAWPEETLYRKITSNQELAKKLKKNSVKLL